MDNPTCPACGHYNAILSVSSPVGIIRKCRDCGYVVSGLGSIKFEDEVKRAVGSEIRTLREAVTQLGWNWFAESHEDGAVRITISRAGISFPAE